ncbi:MAG: AbrB/MazE/SpoVT family DNA-binding domain-containing protein [Candidatus Limnocylindrales bacterium]
MALTRVRGKGQVTLPDSIRKAAKLSEGDYLEITVAGGSVVMRPKKLIDADQAWFWSEEWQRGELQASQDISKGRTRRSGSAEEFLRTLDE